MRYYSSGKSHRNYRPRERWLFSSSKKKSRKRFKQYETAGALRYSNPFGAKTKPLSLRWLKIALLPATAFLWVGLLLYLPYFEVKNYSYFGEKIIKLSELEELVGSEIGKRPWPLDGKNYFLINESAIENALVDKFPLNSANVTKIFPNKLSIVVTEKASSVIYDNGSSYYLTDESGTAIKYLRQVKAAEYTEVFQSSTFYNTSTSQKISSTSTPSTTSPKLLTHIPDHISLKKDFGDYPIIYDTTGKETKEHSSVMDSESIKGIIDFYNYVNGSKMLGVNYFTVDPTQAGITALTSKKWKVMFDPKKDISKQAGNLKIIINDNYPTSYIDLRYGDRIYWK